jgi:hypothetical protein
MQAEKHTDRKVYFSSVLLRCSIFKEGSKIRMMMMMTQVVKIETFCSHTGERNSLTDKVRFFGILFFLCFSCFAGFCYT